MAVAPMQGSSFSWGCRHTGCSFKSKIPAIIVSIFGDQPMWGKIVVQKNIGVHIPFKKLTTSKLLKCD